MGLYALLFSGLRDETWGSWSSIKTLLLLVFFSDIGIKGVPLSSSSLSIAIMALTYGHSTRCLSSAIVNIFDFRTHLSSAGYSLIIRSWIWVWIGEKYSGCNFWRPWFHMSFQSFKTASCVSWKASSYVWIPTLLILYSPIIKPSRILNASRPLISTYACSFRNPVTFLRLGYSYSARGFSPSITT